MAGMKTLIIIFVIMFPVAMITEEDVNHGVCPVPMNKEEEEFIKERERNRELMEEIAREIEMTCSDECKAGLHNCHNDAHCTNTKHSFTCTCNAGYTGDGVNCADINECNTGKHNCDVSSSACYNTIGSFGCACREGYSKNGEDKCTDINECEAGKHNCHANASCKNTKGSFVCTCKPGYSGDGVNCTDVNECITGEHNCDANADCNNTEGSLECTCKPGYSGNGVNCTDVNECATGKHNCNGSFICHNTEGSFLCICREPGYFWNGVNCTAFRLDSNILKTNSSYLYHLGKFLQPAIGYNSHWLPCWWATLHGWDVLTQFHRRCDGKRDTVTIIKKGKYVFGGYTDIPWGSAITQQERSIRGDIQTLDCDAIKGDPNKYYEMYWRVKGADGDIGYCNSEKKCWKSKSQLLEDKGIQVVSISTSALSIKRTFPQKTTAHTVTFICQVHKTDNTIDISEVVYSSEKSSGAWSFTHKAFIFSMSNKEELDPFMSKVKRPDWAIYRGSAYGPVFGWDICIVNNANNNSNSNARLGRDYPAPAAVQDPDTILAGTKYFSPDEVEVFYLDPTQ